MDCPLNGHWYARVVVECESEAHAEMMREELEETGNKHGAIVSSSLVWENGTSNDDT